MRARTVIGWLSGGVVLTLALLGDPLLTGTPQAEALISTSGLSAPTAETFAAASGIPVDSERAAESAPLPIQEVDAGYPPLACQVDPLRAGVEFLRALGAGNAEIMATLQTPDARSRQRREGLVTEGGIRAESYTIHTMEPPTGEDTPYRLFCTVDFRSARGLDCRAVLVELIRDEAGLWRVLTAI